MGQSFKRKVFIFPGMIQFIPAGIVSSIGPNLRRRGLSAAMTSISAQKTGRVVMAGSWTVRLTAGPHAQTSK